MTDWCWMDVRTKVCETCKVPLDKKLTIAFTDKPGETKWYCEKCGVEVLKIKYPDRVKET